MLELGKDRLISSSDEYRDDSGSGSDWVDKNPIYEEIDSDGKLHPHCGYNFTLAPRLVRFWVAVRFVKLIKNK
jgi:hypothetical protein